jgi:GNAT superfamily N-acetyltransferase
MQTSTVLTKRETPEIRQISKKYTADKYKFLVSMFQASYQDISESTGFELFSETQFEQSGNKEYLLSTLEDARNHTTLIAVDSNDCVVGTIGLIHNGASVEMHMLYVDPLHLGRGIAAQLWARAQSLIASNTVVVLDVFECNTHAREIYEHWGFVHTTGQKYPFRWDSWPENINIPMTRYTKL